MIVVVENSDILKIVLSEIAATAQNIKVSSLVLQFPQKTTMLVCWTLLLIFLALGLQPGV